MEKITLTVLCGKCLVGSPGRCVLGKKVTAAFGGSRDGSAVERVDQKADPRCAVSEKRLGVCLAAE